MRGIILTAFLITSLISSAALAANDLIVHTNDLPASKMPREWFTCHTDADCGVVYACGQVMGVNVEHREEAQYALCKLEDCPPQCTSVPQTAAIGCVDGLCAVRPLILRPAN